MKSISNKTKVKLNKNFHTFQKERSANRYYLNQVFTQQFERLYSIFPYNRHAQAPGLPEPVFIRTKTKLQRLTSDLEKVKL